MCHSSSPGPLRDTFDKNSVGARIRQPADAAPKLLWSALEIIHERRSASRLCHVTCGCVVGRYRDVGSTREIVYVEEKGVGCESHAHRRNHTVSRT